MQTIRMKRPKTAAAPLVAADVLMSQIGGVFLPESVRATLELLVFLPDVRTIILFGSRAVGDHDERSDFDVAISAPTLTRTEFSKMRDAITHSRTLYKISVSLLETMPERLRARVTSQGLTVYERTEAKR
jgi:predicted nucleotidyltransferase